MIRAMFCLLLVLPAVRAIARPPAPPPAEGDASSRVEKLVEAIRKNKPSIGDPFFFPGAEFPEVKGIKNPSKYFDYLLAVYHKDIQTIREKLSDPDHVKLVRFGLGRGRNWIPHGKEGNKVPYYATYKSPLVLLDGKQERTFYVRTMITWKGQWVCTHLLRKKLNETVK